MSLVTRGSFSHGDDHGDIRECLVAYSTKLGDPPTRFANAVCTCGCDSFLVELDPDAGIAILECRDCEAAFLVCNRKMSLAKAENSAEDLQLCQCLPPCNEAAHQVVGGVNTKIVKDSDTETVDARWFFFGLRCVKCGLVACWGDWRADCTIKAILGDGEESLTKPCK